MRDNRQLALTVALLSLFIGFALGYRKQRQEHRAASQDRYIRVLAYEGILSPDLLARFKETTQIRVLLDTAVTAQQMAFHLKENPDEYDVVIPMLDQIQTLREESRLAPLSSADIPNLERVAIDFQHDPESPGRQMFASLLWGLEGLLVNTEKVPEPKRLKDVFSNKNLRKRIAWSSHPTEVRRLLQRRGLLEPGDDPDENTEALKVALHDLLTFVDLQSEPAPERLASGQYWIVQTSNGRASFALHDHPKWAFVLPEEGASLWMMGASIPSQCHNPKWARHFLQFLLDPKQAELLVATSHQATTSTQSWPGLPELAQSAFLKKVPLNRINFINDAPAGTLQNGEIEKFLAGLK